MSSHTEKERQAEKERQELLDAKLRWGAWSRGASIGLKDTVATPTPTPAPAVADKERQALLDARLRWEASIGLKDTVATPIPTPAPAVADEEIVADRRNRFYESIGKEPPDRAAAPATVPAQPAPLQAASQQPGLLRRLGEATTGPFRSAFQLFTTPFSTPSLKDASLAGRLGRTFGDPFSAFAETATRQNVTIPLAILRDPTRIPEAAREAPTALHPGKIIEEEAARFEERPWYQQLPMSLFDPLSLGALAGRTGLKTLRAATRGPTGLATIPATARPTGAIPEAAVPRGAPITGEAAPLQRALPAAGQTANQRFETARSLMHESAVLRAETPEAQRTFEAIRKAVMSGEGDDPVMSPLRVAGRWVIQVTEGGWPHERLAKYGFTPADNLPTTMKGLYYVDPPVAAALPPTASLPPALPPGRQVSGAATRPAYYVGRGHLPPQLKTAVRDVQQTQARLVSEGASAVRVDAAAQALESEVAGLRLAGTARVPVRKAGQAVGSGSGTPPPRRTDVALGDDLGVPTHESASTTPFRKAEGAANLAGLELEEFSANATRLQRGLTFDEATMRPLFEALHGERSIDELSPQFRAIYDEAKRMLAKEEEESLAFFQAAKGQGLDEFITFDVENMAKRFMAHEDYFPRGWKQPEGPQGVGRGRLGATPGPLKPRVDATFKQLLDSGREPVSWNPLEMVARRRMAGVDFREQVKIVNNLKIRGLVEPANMAPDNWRVPNVGVVFEGRPLPNGGISRQLFTPEGTAAQLEAIYGDRLKFIVGGKNILPAVRTWTNRFKRLKLAGSLFQHIDFGTRLLGPIFAPSSIIRGVPLKAPSLAWRLVKSSIRESPRAALRRDMLSGKAIFKDFPITYRMLIDEGWGVHGDISLIQREGVSAVQELIKSRGLIGKPLEAGQKISRFFESGLFRGVYREAQRFSLENFIIPSLRRQHPTWTPRQIAANAAEVANVQFSTLANWQTILRKSPHLKEFFYNMAFSFNESESLIRQALGTMKGPNKRLWIEHHLGMFFGLATIANLINYAATGKPLPLGSYSPISLDDPYGPTKAGYNGRFLSPQVPGMTSKDGAPVYIDLVGQMDTVFRWALDPEAAATTRVNVIPRAIENLRQRESFFGERLDTPALKATQFAADILLPIPATAGLAGLRSAFPETLKDIVPRGEKRMKPLGQAIQATGLNLRTGNLLEVYPSAEAYFDLETAKERNQYREENPQDEAVLFIFGRFTSLQTMEAKIHVLELIKRHGINPRDIKGYKKVFEILPR